MSFDTAEQLADYLEPRLADFFINPQQDSFAGLDAAQHQRLLRLQSIEDAEERSDMLLGLCTRWLRHDPSLTVAAGEGSAAANNRGIAVAGDVRGGVANSGDHNNITVHNHAPRGDRKHLLACYLRWLASRTVELPYQLLDPAVMQDKAAPLRLHGVFTSLLTDASDPEGREAEAAALEGNDKQAAGLRRLERAAEQLPAISLLNREARLALLGDPGSGKTSLVNYLCWCLAQAQLKALGVEDAADGLAALRVGIPDKKGDLPEEPLPWDHGSLLPLRVVLREFIAGGLADNDDPAQLLDFIKRQLQAPAQAEAWPVILEHLDQHGGLLLLDGFDEVPDADQNRERLKALVRGIQTCYPRLRILLTSRPYAYQQGRWQMPGFHQAALGAFTDGQIRRFIHNWYAEANARKRPLSARADQDAGGLERAIFAQDRLLDLARRPLLLTLMASLHAFRGGTLPTRREGLYHEAVALLLAAWEQQRLDENQSYEPSITEFLQLDDRDALRKKLEALAFHAHRHQAEARGTADISADQLKAELDSLRGKDQRPIDKDALLAFLHQRAGILICRDNAGPFSFPHRSFQEYLAACHLTDATITLDDQALDFPENIAVLVQQDPERWREVALLAGAKSRRGTAKQVWELAEALCHDHGKQAWGLRVAGELMQESGDLAGKGVQGRDDSEDAARLQPKQCRVVQAMRAPLLAQVTGTELPAAERAACGVALADLGDPRPGVNGVDGMQFCLVPRGPFYMGSPPDDDLGYDDEWPARDYKLDHDYALARYPVTTAQFIEFVNDAADFTPGAPDVLREQANAPAIRVSWDEAMQFCDWLTRRWQGRLPEGWCVTLPSEPEWEKAARGGLEHPSAPARFRIGDLAQVLESDIALLPNEQPRRRYSWGDKADSNRMNFGGTQVGKHSAVGAFPGGASVYGCEELSGNVWEWTRSLWDNQPYTAQGVDPRQREDRGPQRGARRVLRGGAFLSSQQDTRCACRGRLDPADRDHDVGFRPVLLPLSSAPLIL